MLKVISNTTPILSLLKLEKLYLLEELYQKIIIPTAVYDEIQADLVILDELLGRRYAKQLDFKLTGTIGILLKSKEMGLISEIKPLLNELIEKGTWLNPSLIFKALTIAKEY